MISSEMSTANAKSRRQQRQIVLDHSIGDHRLHGQVIVPGAAMLLEAVFAHQNGKMTMLEEILLLRPLFVAQKNGQKLSIWLEQNGAEVKLFSTPEESGQPILVAKHHQTTTQPTAIIPGFKLPANAILPKSIEHSAFYAFMCDRVGYEYGDAFRSVQRVEYSHLFDKGRLCAIGRCTLTERAMQAPLHVRLDALWQAMAFCILSESSPHAQQQQQRRPHQSVLAPFAVKWLQIGPPELLQNGEEEMHFEVRLDNNATTGRCAIVSRQGRRVLLCAEEVTFRPLPPPSLVPSSIGVPPLEEQIKECRRVLIRSVACRLPGGIHSPAQFWRALCAGLTTDERIPASRVADRNALLRGNFNGANTPSVEGAHFLCGDLARFDAPFFGVSALEAEAMDPQQRVLLECVWECVEAAGARAQMADCGFFIGSMGSEYLELLAEAHNSAPGNALQMLGSAASTLSGRLAHFFDSKGPALSVDTACSSSLVAMQLAHDAIRRGQCQRAIVGGVNLILGAKGLAQRANAGMLAADGRCRAFDADASGYGRADGCVAMLLEAVEDRRELEHTPHWAVVEAIETGHDGRSVALTAPNGAAQRELIARCLGRLSSAQRSRLRCWECHGTGTALGDPVEFLALARALREGKVPAGVWAGSAKANIGHTEAASGLVGVLKALLQLRHAKVPPLAHFRRLNPQIARGIAEWGEQEQEEWPVRLATDIRALLDSSDTKQKDCAPDELLAGVSSFGVAGTNACAVLSLDRQLRGRQMNALRAHLPHSTRFPLVVPLSAKSAHSLQQMAAEHLALLERNTNLPDGWDAAAVCTATALQRAQQFAGDHRAAILVNAAGEEAHDGRPEQALELELEQQRQQQRLVLVQECRFTRPRFRLGFWRDSRSTADKFLLQVPAYGNAFNTLLGAIGKRSSAELSQTECQLVDTFARWRTLFTVGVVGWEDEEKEEEESAEEEEQPLVWLRALLKWDVENGNGAEMAEIVRKLVRQMARDCEDASGGDIGQEGGSEDEESRLEECAIQRSREDGGPLLLVIDPGATRQRQNVFPLSSPLDLRRLLALVHCGGRPIRWDRVFPVPTCVRPLLPLVPLPAYPFDRSRRFWVGRDAWLEAHQGAREHPLLGTPTTVVGTQGTSTVAFEGLLCSRRMPWLAQVHLGGRPLLLCVGPLLEMCAAAVLRSGLLPGCSAFRVRFQHFGAVQMPPSGSQWLQTSVVFVPRKKEGRGAAAVVEVRTEERQIICRAQVHTAADGGGGHPREGHRPQQSAKASALVDANSWTTGGSAKWLDIEWGPAWRMEQQQQPQEGQILARVPHPHSSTRHCLFSPVVAERALTASAQMCAIEMDAYEQFAAKLDAVEVYLAAQDEEKEHQFNLDWEEAEQGQVLELERCGKGRVRVFVGGRLAMQVQFGAELAAKVASGERGEGKQTESNGTADQTPPSCSSASNSPSSLAASVRDLFASALPSGELPPDWLDRGLAELGMDSLATMALAQTLNQQFRLHRPISAGEVFMADRAGALVQLLAERLQSAEAEEQSCAVAKVREQRPMLGWEEWPAETAAEAAECTFSVHEERDDDDFGGEEPMAAEIHVQMGGEERLEMRTIATVGTGETVVRSFGGEQNTDFDTAVDQLTDALFANAREECLSILLSLHFGDESLLQMASTGVLLLSRALLLLHSAKRRLHRVRVSLVGGAGMDSPIWAFVHTFLRNVATELPSLELRPHITHRFGAFQPTEGNEAETPKGTWLITGGTGGIGLAMAHWLATRFGGGLRHLVLVARSRPEHSSEFWPMLEQMRRRGCSVELVQADVADAQAMDALFHRAHMRHLDGVVHSAGVLLNAPLAATDAHTAHSVLSAKAQGALVLHQMLAKHSLRPTHFVVNSSLASLHPNRGQCAYAAANAFCDALMRQRRRQGLAGSTLNWANWLQVGMAANRPGVNKLLRWTGLPGLSTRTALACFQHSLLVHSANGGQLALVRLDWEQLRQRSPQLHECFRQKTGQPIATDDGDQQQNKKCRTAETTNGGLKGPPPKDGEQKDQDDANDDASRGGVELRIGKVLREQLLDMNDHNNAAAFDAHMGFMELGLDSLRLYQFAHVLQREFARDQVRISVLDLFEHSTPAALAEHLRRQMKPAKGRNAAEEKVQLDDASSGTEWAAQQHRLEGRALVPAAVQLHHLFAHSPTAVLQNVKFHRKMDPDQLNGAAEVRQKGNGLHLVGLSHQTGAPEQQELLLFSSCETAEERKNSDDVDAWANARNENAFELDVAQFYAGLAAAGMEYGAALQLVGRAQIWRQNDEKAAIKMVRARMSAQRRGAVGLWEATEFGLQTLAAALFRAPVPELFLPTEIASFALLAAENGQWTAQESVHCVGRVTVDDGSSPFVCGDVCLFSAQNRPLLLLRGISARRINRTEQQMDEWRRHIRPHSDLALIAISGTFSGCASVDALWEALLQGRDCLSSVGTPPPPPNAANADAASSLPPFVAASGLCPSMEHLDTHLFAGAALSLAEWRRLDPQLRLFAEHAYAALEQSGYATRRTQLRVGCFAGAEESSPDYGHAAVGDARETGRGSLLGMFRRNQHCFCAQFTSHLLGLRGPSLSVFSACSSSVGALAQAQSALLAHQVDICLAGAVHLVHPNDAGHQPVLGQPLSRLAHCRPFCAEQGGGIVRGSACSVAVLKRADHAIRDGDPILAIVRSIELSNDAGRKANFMAPSVDGQREAIERALAQAEVPREAIAFWECHATGTPTGDAAELEALERALPGSPKHRPSPPPTLLVGSARANLGHCFTASGMCSLAKLVRILDTGLVPPQLLPPEQQQEATGPLPGLLEPHAAALRVHWGPGPLALARHPGAFPLCAGASSFGIGGTNGALVLMRGPPTRLKGLQPVPKEEPLLCSDWHFFPLSAASTPSLHAFCAQLAHYVDNLDVDALARTANTLQSRRDHHRFRAFAWARSGLELAHKLRQLLRRGSEAQQQVVDTHGSAPPEWGAFFCPQGVQFPDMLAAECALSPFLSAALRQLVPAPAPVQCSLFAVAQSIFRFFRAAGLPAPRLAFGHSLGEYGAICAADAFSAANCVDLLRHRERLMEGTAPARMLLVRDRGSCATEQAQLIPPGVALSARLSPRLRVLVGPAASIAAHCDALLRDGCAARVLDGRLARGFHSAQAMAPIVGEFRAAVRATVGPQWGRMSAQTVVLSNLDGKPLGGAYAKKADEHLAEHLQRTVRLDKCLESLLRDFPRVRVLLECGPTTAILREALSDYGASQVQLVGTVQRQQHPEAVPQLLTAIGQMWQNGLSVDFVRLFGLPAWDWDERVPGYVFDRMELKPTDGSAQTAEQWEAAGAKGRERADQQRGEQKNNNEHGIGRREHLAELVAQVWRQCLPPDSVPSNWEQLPTLDFVALGGNSLQAAQIIWELERRLQMAGQLHLDMLFLHPTFGQFVDAVWQQKTATTAMVWAETSEHESDGPQGWTGQMVVPLRLADPNPSASGSSSRRPVSAFCFHPISGTALPYHALAQLLPPFVNVYGVQFSPDVHQHVGTLAELAAVYAQKIIVHQHSNNHPGQSHSGLLLLGHSLGGVLAREVALVLNRRHGTVCRPIAAPMVVMFDSWALGQTQLCPDRVRQYVTGHFAHLAQSHRVQIGNGAQRLAELLRAHTFERNAPEQEEPEIWLFRTTKTTKLDFSDYVDTSPDGGWSSLCPRVHLVRCDADHEGILRRECLERYAEGTLHAICEQMCLGQEKEEEHVLKF